jgi:putative endonuclease
MQSLLYFAYLLVSEDGTRSYVGWTTDLETRLALHNGGKGARSTRGRRWLLVYAERHPNRHSAMSREWHLKRDRVFRKAIRDSVTTAALIPGTGFPRR